MTIKDTFSPLLAKVKDNPRLRLGLWLIVGIVWLYGVLLLRDASLLASSELAMLGKKVARLQAESAQTAWVTRVAPAEALQVNLESRLWREGTIGLAQATFQDWLTQGVQQANLARPVVTAASQEEATAEKNASLNTAPALLNHLWRVSAKLGFDFTPQGLYAFLGRLEGHDKQVIVENLTIRGSPTPRAEIVVVAYFQKPAALENLAEPANDTTKGIRP